MEDTFSGSSRGASLYPAGASSSPFTHALTGKSDSSLWTCGAPTPPSYPELKKGKKFFQTIGTASRTNGHVHTSATSIDAKSWYAEVRKLFTKLKFYFI